MLLERGLKRFDRTGSGLSIHARAVAILGSLLPIAAKKIPQLGAVDVGDGESAARAGGILLCGRLARGSKGRHRFLDSGQKARTSQQNRRQARDGGEVKEQPFLQRLPAEELRVDNVRIRDVFFRLI